MSASVGQFSQKIPKGYKAGRLQQFTPEQMGLFSQMFGHLGPDSQLSKLASGDEATFKQMEAPALRQFGEMQGNIASRFSGMGMGGRRSSGFQNTMSQQGANLAQNLQSQRQQLQRQALSELMGMSNQLLGQRPFESHLIEKQQRPSFGQQMIGGLAPLAGAGIGALVGGPMGASIGGQLGSAVGAGFTGGQSPGMNFSGIGDLPTSWG